MSDPRAKAERSAAKDNRQMPAPDAPSTGRKRSKATDKPWCVKTVFRFSKHPYSRRYAKETDARKVYDKLVRENQRGGVLRYYLSIELAGPDGVIDSVEAPND